MPHIAITMFPGRDDKTKEALAGKMKETLVKELGVSESVVSVSVQDVRKEDWDAEMQKIPEEGMFSQIQ
ncbi:MAG: tautomerase family protein [[Clostridium] symbiosum]